MQALPPAEARVIRTPAHTHKTVKQPKNQSKTVSKRPPSPQSHDISLKSPSHWPAASSAPPSLLSLSSIRAILLLRSRSVAFVVDVGCIRPRSLGKPWVWRSSYPASSPPVPASLSWLIVASPVGSGSISMCRNCPSRPVCSMNSAT
jgi:hypothetical protein